MKKYIGLGILLFVIIGVLFAASITNFPGGIVIGTEAEETTADVTPGSEDLFVVGTLEVDGNARFDGAMNHDIGSLVQLDTATAVTVGDRYVLVVGSNAASGAFAMTSAAVPFISTSAATEGDIITIIGTSATGTVTLSDNSQVAGSCLELDGNTITLAADSNITLFYYSGSWIQTGGINTID